MGPSGAVAHSKIWRGGAEYERERVRGKIKMSLKTLERCWEGVIGLEME